MCCPRGQGVLQVLGTAGASRQGKYHVMCAAHVAKEFVKFRALFDVCAWRRGQFHVMSADFFPQVAKDGKWSEIISPMPAAAGSGG